MATFLYNFHLFALLLFFLGAFPNWSKQAILPAPASSLTEQIYDFLSRGYMPTSQVYENVYDRTRKSWKQPIFKYTLNGQRNSFPDPTTHQSIKCPAFLKVSTIYPNNSIVYSASIYETSKDLLPLMSLPDRPMLRADSFANQFSLTVDPWLESVATRCTAEFREVLLSNTITATDGSQLDDTFLKDFSELISSAPNFQANSKPYFDFIAKYGLYYFSDITLGALQAQQWYLATFDTSNRTQLVADMKANFLDISNLSISYTPDISKFGGNITNDNSTEFLESIKRNRTLVTGKLSHITELGYLQAVNQQKPGWKVILDGFKKAEGILNAEYFYQQWKKGVMVAFGKNAFYSTAIGLNDPSVVMNYLEDMKGKGHLSTGNPYYRVVTQIAHVPLNYMLDLRTSLND